MAHYTFQFSKVYEDDDGMLEVELFAANPNVSGRNKFFCYPQMLSDYADKLLNYFPIDQAECVEYESGSPERYLENDYNEYVCFKMLPYGGKGGVLIEIELIYETWPAHLGDYSCKFSLVTYVAGVNDLGNSIKSWLKNTDTPMRIDWDG
ncbi:MAG: hypothetical protein KAJ40_06890 [Alphaproteobacteria bacterium]|nr:hypothetical protein [Alphaproteobacteria bacterium]